MGHANIATTEGYAHHVPKRNAAAALTQLIEADSEQIGGESRQPSSNARDGTARTARQTPADTSPNRL